MALTPDEIRQWIINKLDVSTEPNWSDQNDVSLYRGLHVKHAYQLEDLRKLYKAKVPRLVRVYEEALTEIARYIKNFDIPTAELQNDFEGLKDKVLRIAEKWLAVKREIEGREKGYFTRTPIGTEYYIDLNNGSDASPHDGLKYGNYNADSGTDTDTIVDTEPPRTTSGDWDGAYVWNVTRNAGSLINTSTYAAGWTFELVTPITGQTTGDEYYIIDAWKTISQYTSVTGRSPGDIAYVRANTDEIRTANGVFDEAGSVAEYVQIIGCDSVVNDPWEDGSDVKPIIDFNDASYYMELESAFWKITKMHFRQGGGTNGNFKVGGNVTNVHFKEVEFRDASNAAGKGCYLERGYNVLFEDCVFKDNLYTNLQLERSHARIKGGTIDGGTETTDYGVFGFFGSQIEIVDTEIGQISDHDGDDIRLFNRSIAFLRNVKLGVAGVTIFNDGSALYEEDADGVYGAGKITSVRGIITKDDSIKTGNADFSCKLEPNANCGIVAPLSLTENDLIKFPVNVKLTASVEKTITIKIRSLGAWSTYPTNTELYIEAVYYDSGSDAGRSSIKSTQVLSDETTWISFTVTFTPLRDGEAYIGVYLKKYEAAKGCYVNGEIGVI